MNARVDYTLLDRWRASHAWSTRRRQHEAAAAARRRREGTADSRRAESDDRPGRVVHMPLSD